MEKRKTMPIFKNGIDCSIKIKWWLSISVALAVILIHAMGYFFGLLGATITMLVSLVVVWYIMDNYGDYLFKDKENAPTQNQLNSYKQQPFPYRN